MASSIPCLMCGSEFSYLSGLLHYHNGHVLCNDCCLTVGPCAPESYEEDYEDHGEYDDEEDYEDYDDEALHERDPSLDLDDDW